MKVRSMLMNINASSFNCICHTWDINDIDYIIYILHAQKSINV